MGYNPTEQFSFERCRGEDSARLRFVKMALYEEEAAKLTSGSQVVLNTAINILRGEPGRFALPAQCVMLPSNEDHRLRGERSAR